MIYLAQQALNALQLGSIYALIALGYTMVYGVLTMINFAHGDVFMAGAFLCFIAGTFAKVQNPADSNKPFYELSIPQIRADLPVGSNVFRQRWPENPCRSPIWNLLRTGMSALH